MKSLFSIIIALLLTLAATAQPEPIRLNDYHLADIPSDTARFHVLRQAHIDALNAGTTLSYRGIDTIRIAIPAGAKPIPLGQHNDFENTVFIVLNNTADLFLFSLTPPATPIECHLPLDSLCAAIDCGDYRFLPIPKDRRWLLHIIDSTPWVNQRIGHSYGHYREELIRLDNGLSTDRPTMPYSATTSRPCLFGRSIENDSTFLFSHITLLRDSLSTHKTFLLNIEYQYLTTLHNITVVTPKSNMADDCIIRIYHCASVTLDSLTLLGSYSRTNHSGYGLLMDNCRDTRVLHLCAKSPWGIFGTNNMHTTLLQDSRFDRFDIHCYGRDVTFLRCTQADSYNQFSSVYGTIAFDSCAFSNFTPLLIESSYNAYPRFLLLMHHCRWHLTPQCHTLINAGHHDTLTAPRPELSSKCLPDIFIDGLTIDGPRRLQPLLIHYGGRVNGPPIQGLSAISILHLGRADGYTPRIQLSDKRIPLSQPVGIFVTAQSGLTILNTSVHRL